MMTKELLEEFVQIKHIKCYEQVAKIMDSCLEQIPEGLRWTEGEEGHQGLLFDSTLEKIFSTSHKNYNILQKEKEQ